MTEPIRVSSRPTSNEDSFLLDWGRESFKATAPALNDTLQRLLTVTTALIGGGFVAAKSDVIPAGWSVAVLGLLIGSMIAAMAGLIPRGRPVDLNDPDDIARFERNAISRKEHALQTAFIVLIFAFVVGLIGVTISQIKAAQVKAEVTTSIH